MNYKWRSLVLFVGVVTYGLNAQERVDFKRKEREMTQLLGRAVRYFKRHTLAQACHKFSEDPAWRKGELFVFVLDGEGNCYAFGDQKKRIYGSFADYKDSVGVPLVKAFLNHKSSRPLSVMLNNAYMHVNVALVEKDAKTYILGCGFYPEDVEKMVENLVYRAVDMIEELGIADACIMIDNPYGHFVRGDSYVFVVGEDGVVYAQGGQKPLVGNNVFDESFEADEFPSQTEESTHKEFLRKFLVSNEKQIWLPPFMFNNTLKREFVVKYKDKKTQKIFLVGSAYYPEVNDDAIYSLVEKAIAYIKTEGLSVALAEFNKPNGYLSLGIGRIAVYTLDAFCLANGEDADFIGYNLMDRADAQGHYTMRRLIDDVKKNGHAWINLFAKNSYKLIYAEQLDLPDRSIIITAGYWPESKSLTAQGMVDRAVDYVARHGKAAALAKFSSFDSDFLRGDVKIMALDRNGLILADGPYLKHLIWSEVGLRDKFGRRIIDKVVSTAAEGGGWIAYRRLNAPFRAYTKEVLVPDAQGSSSGIMILMAGYYL